MKRIILLCIIVILAGCQNKVGNKNFEFAVFDEKNIYTFSENGSKLELLEKIKRTDGNQNFVDYYLANDKEFIYTLTQSMSPNRDTYIVKMNKDDFSSEKEKFNYGNTLSIDENYIYTTSISVDKEDIFKYDKKTLKKISQKTIQDENVNIIRDIVDVEGVLYVLVGTVNRENFSQGTYLWKMDRDFNIVEKIDLNYKLGGYLRMVLVNKSLYMIEGTKGVTAAGEPGPGDNLVEYNLETKEIKNIKLKMKYPYNLYYDKNNNNLIVQHYGIYEKEFPFTIYSLDNKEQKIIKFPEYREKASNIVFSCGKENYYFLLSKINKVVKYNIQEGDLSEYSLAEFNMKNPHFVVGK